MTFKESPPLKLGDTFLNVHLWVVCTLPDSERSVVAINFTTKRSDSDDSCVIRAGEHPFVAHDTVLAYSKARVWGMELQQAILGLGDECRRNASVKDVVLSRIQEGGLKSPHLSPKMKGMIRDSMALQSKSKVSSQGNEGVARLRMKPRW